MSELLKFCALAASALLWAAVAVAWAARHGAFASAWRDWRACPRTRKALAGIAVVAVVAWAGVKPSENETTDSHGFTRIEERESATPVGGPAALSTENEEGRRRGEDGEVLDRLGESGAPSPSNPVNPVEESPCLPSPNNSMFSDSNSPPPGYILSRVGTNEAFLFDPPEGAVIAESWRRRGAASDWRRLSFDGWEFPFGGTAFSDLVVFANGTILFSANAALRPLTATLGLVPEGGSGGLEGAPSGSGVPTSQTSLFWHVLTPSNTLQLTWHNALLHRSPTNPVSFQVELFPSGNFAFRYDLSALASDGLLTNALAAADSGFPGGETHQVLSRGTTSLTFRSDNERRCDDARDAFDKALGGLDPLAYPSGSTNTVWEHLVYTGMTNGVFAYPQSTERTAVLRVSVAGAGRGELLVGDRAVPLVGPGGKATDFTDLRGLGEGASTNLHESTQISIRENPCQFADETTRALVAPCGLSAPDGPFLLLPVPRGVTVPLYLRTCGALSVSLSSADFAFGRLPDLAVLRPTGRINFPNASATVPCFHDYRARRKEVTLPVGADAESLACTWAAPDSVAVENRPPRAALLTGRFDGRTTTPVTYTLSHPDYLFGQKTYSQVARFCPLPPMEEKEDPSVGRHYGSRDEDDEDESCWHCVWELCSRGCDCCPWCHCGEEQGSERPGGASEEEEPQPGDYETAVTNWPHLSDVLKIREPPLYADPIRLEVPDAGAPRCCPCPDHATNWVAVAYLSDRLKVVDESGLDFRRAAETVDVRLAGVRPSRAVGDAFVSLATNGAVRLDGAYTVLGVGVRSPGVDLVVLDSLNADFGLPIPVATNAAEAAALELVTDVGLPGGNVRVGFEGASAPFALWAWDLASNAYRPLASSDGGPLDISLAAWRRLVGGATDAATARTRVAVTASAPGAATLVFRYWGVFGGRFVEDVARQRLTAVAPRVRADIDRDGKMGESDDAVRLAGRPFRFWFNEDCDKGDFVGQVADATPNADDLKVNGKLDLVNLFPVEIDVSPFRRAWGSAVTVRLRAAAEGLRLCVLGDGFSSESVLGLATAPVSAADGNPLESAALTPLGSDGADLAELAGRPLSEPVALAFEAAGPVDAWSGPEVVVSLGDAEVYRERLPVSIMSVDEFYRLVSMRGAEFDSDFSVVLPGSCLGWPDEELSDGYVFFLHGFFVSEANARAWNRAMFKRLWWAGSRARYCGVTWNGDAGLLTAFSYHLNAFNAQKTASCLKRLVNSVSGTKSVIAHSLGNMVVCEAIREGMSADRYFMLNAAVASEAFDGSLQATADNVGKYVPDSWKPYPSGTWCANWHALFPASDDRSRLKWKDAFAEVCDRTDVYNYYSTGDQVLEADDDIPSAFSGAINFRWPVSFSWSFPFLNVDRPYDLTLDRYAWQKQEVLKGVDPLVATLEAGWRFESDCTPDEAWQRLWDGSIVTNAVFGYDVAAFHRPSSPIVDVFRARAYNVPAVSKPVGGTSVERMFRDNVDLNENTIGLRPNGWGRKSEPYKERWLHSDIKDMSYYHVYRIMQSIVDQGELK